MGEAPRDYEQQGTDRAKYGGTSIDRLGDIGLCSVVAAELACGVAQSGSARNRQALEMFLAPLTILPFDAAAVWAYGDLRADLERRGTPVGALDTMIAAHALSLHRIYRNPVPHCPLVCGVLQGAQGEQWADAYGQTMGRGFLPE